MSLPEEAQGLYGEVEEAVEVVVGVVVEEAVGVVVEVAVEVLVEEAVEGEGLEVETDRNHLEEGICPSTLDDLDATCRIFFLKIRKKII